MFKLNATRRGIRISQLRLGTVGGLREFGLASMIKIRDETTTRHHGFLTFT